MAGSCSDFYQVPGSGSNSEEKLNQLSGCHSEPAHPPGYLYALFFLPITCGLLVGR